MSQKTTFPAIAGACPSCFANYDHIWVCLGKTQLLVGFLPPKPWYAESYSCKTLPEVAIFELLPQPAQGESDHQILTNLSVVLPIFQKCLVLQCLKTVSPSCGHKPTVQLPETGAMHV